MQVDDQKKQWRRRAKAERAELTVDHGGFCRTLAQFLADNVAVDKRVVVYQAMGDEVDLAALVRSDPEPNQRFALTRTPDTDLVLTVHGWGGPEEKHPYGYTQPLAGSASVPDAQIGAVLVPALAFDRSGRRLGRGKGYYDRFLARLDPGCLRIGITGGYVVDRLPTDDYDVTMTHLAFATEVLAVPLDEDSATGSANS